MKALKTILLVILVIAVAIAFWFLPVRQWFSAFETFIQSWGVFGPIIFILAYAVLTVLLFPASFVTLGAGTIFGLKLGLVVA